MCREFGITVTGFSPLGASSYISIGREDPSESHMLNGTIKQIACHHRKTTAQVVLRWALQSGGTIIPKSVHKDRLKENTDLFDFELTPVQMASISSLDCGRRYNDPGEWVNVKFAIFD